jgi:sulfur carrier protein
VGGGLLRTGCGPGPLEPDLGNPSEGNAAESATAAPGDGKRPFVFEGAGVTIVVNGQAMEVPDGLSIDDLLTRLGVKREFTAVAVNRDVTPKSHYASTRLADGDKIEIVRPMGGG